MDFGDARKEYIEGSDAMLLQGDKNSQHKNIEEVISHNKPKKDANLHVTSQGIFLILLSILFLWYCLLYSTIFAQFDC